MHDTIFVADIYTASYFAGQQNKFDNPVSPDPSNSLFGGAGRMRQTPRYRLIPKGHDTPESVRDF